MSEGIARRPAWHARYRWVTYLNTLAALVWTALMVLPFAPFSDVPPIIVGGGPGTWLTVAYLMFLAVGIGGFGVLSSLLATMELHEGRLVDSKVMWPASVLLCVGFVGGCILLGTAGAVGGYESTFEGASTAAIHDLLSPYVYPITALTLAAVIGAVLVVLSMARARWPAA